MWGTVPIKDAPPPSLYPPSVTDMKKAVDVTPVYAALAGVAAGVVGTRVMAKKSAKEEDHEGKE